MSTTPPEQPSAPPPPPAGYGGLGRAPVTGAILPVAGVSSRVDASDWFVATTVLTAAYVISRGIAKASRVLEQ